MKIINFNKNRRRFEPRIDEEDEMPKKKKALLIGIVYKSAGTTVEELKEPHRDAAAMRDLLIRTYGYDPADIVMLLDQEGCIQPTRYNMLREIDRLVEGARSGDHFFFHCKPTSYRIGYSLILSTDSGHTCQVENKNNSEEDGMDECLVPCDDDETGHIRDNELRQKLVDTLPVGSQLIAVFDSCHSESLLDLDHYRCNRVWVPWVSKGKRRSDTRRNEIVRSAAIFPRRSSSVPVSRRQKVVYQHRRISNADVVSRKTSIEQVLTSNQCIMVRRTSKKTRTHSVQVADETPVSWLGDNMSSPIQRTLSPERIFPCSGCCERTGPGLNADVISLSSCKDSQTTYEIGEAGASMTKMLVEILDRDPSPTFNNLLRDLSHMMHKSAVLMHDGVRRYKHKKKIYRNKMRRLGKPFPEQTDEPTLEMDNFQDPQLASHVPLDMNSRWAP